MSYAFISYKREDEARVAKITRALENAGVPLWWDRSLIVGENWREQIAEKLEAAGCVIVVWSQESVAPEGRFVRDEASRGLARNILVPVRIDKVSPPIGFGETQVVDLAGWKGDPRDPFFQDLVAAANAKLDGGSPPPPKGPRARLARRLTFGAVTSGSSMAVLSAFAVNAFGVTSKICTIPGPQPAVEDVCGDMHIGGQPSHQERLDWAALPKGDCTALGEFLRKYPGGAHSEEASHILQASETDAVWRPATRQMPLHVYPYETDPASTEAAARANALKAGQSDADGLCRPLGLTGTVFRYLSANASATTWRCAPLGSRWTCSFEGWANCQVEQRTPRCG